MGSSLFGGSKSSSTPVDMTPKPFKDLQQPFADVLRSLLGIGTGGGTSGIPNYGAEQVAQDGQTLSAPLGQNEQSLLQQLMQSNQTGGTNVNADQYISDLLAGKYLPGGEQANPFLNASIEAAQRPTLQGLEELLTRTLPGRFTQAGQFTQPQGSSAFDRAAAIATRGTAQAMADIATNMSFQTQEAERNRQNEAIGLNAAQMDTMVKNLQAQALPRLIQEQGIERGMELFKTRLAALLQALGVTQAATSPVISQKSESESTGGIIPGITGLIGAFKG